MSEELLDKEFLDACKTWDNLPKDPPLCERCGCDLSHRRWKQNKGLTHGCLRYCEECAIRAISDKNERYNESRKMKRIKRAEKDN